MDAQKREELIGDFRRWSTLPDRKHSQTFVLGVIGSSGAGKSSLAQELKYWLAGSVVVQANSARYLLHEEGLPWGKNVRELVEGVTTSLLQDGYSVILDGGTAEAENRQATERIGQELVIPVRYVRIKADLRVCEARLQEKYDDPRWSSRFDDFRVNTTEKVVKGLHQRWSVHQELQDSEIPGLVGLTIDNNGTMEQLRREAEFLAKKVWNSLKSR